MNSNRPNGLYLVLIGIFSLIRIGIYIYKMYIFQNIILPEYLTEIGYLLIIQLPLALLTLDLVSILSLLLMKNRAFPVLLISAFAAIAYFWFYMLGLTFLAGIFDLSIIAVSIIQIILLWFTHFKFGRPDH